MDLNRIAVFARVVDEGSFTKAALALGLPKSSVSRAVALLEDELGTRLLQRSSRKLSATEAGMAYYAQVAGALSAIDQANACAAERREVPQGLVRVTAPFDAGRDVFIPIFTRFIEKHPAITIDLMLTARHVDLVEEGVDLGIRAGIIRDQSLIARKITDVRHGLFASRAYVSRHGAPETVAELARRACIIHHGTRGRTTWTLHAGEQVETVEVRGPLAVDDMGAARDAMVQGAGIAFLPPMACARELRAGDVVRLLPAWIGPPVPVSVIYPSARLIPQRVVLVREHLLEELAKIPWACAEEPRRPRTERRKSAAKTRRR
ncbi:MAG TPA: LysR family transcriptional regulator [Polyangiaceae bacterium]|nr:LysR family transcriptional regulator [Polyangiaceae bacterium]